jgi:hypothetical protein
MEPLTKRRAWFAEERDENYTRKLNLLKEICRRKEKLYVEPATERGT